MQITIQYNANTFPLSFWNDCFWIIQTGSYIAILSYYCADVFLQSNKFDDNSKHSNQAIRIIGSFKRASQVNAVQSLHSTKILFNYGSFLEFNIFFFQWKKKIYEKKEEVKIKKNEPKIKIWIKVESVLINVSLMANPN